jgi:hypothetical protein
MKLPDNNPSTVWEVAHSPLDVPHSECTLGYMQKMHLMGTNEIR